MMCTTGAAYLLARTADVGEVLFAYCGQARWCVLLLWRMTLAVCIFLGLGLVVSPKSVSADYVPSAPATSTPSLPILALPAAPTTPSPLSGTTGANVATVVSWQAATGATAYDVYFGVDSSLDATAYQGTQTGTSFSPGTLAYATTYYVRIDAANPTGTTTGAVWNFTTESTPVSGGGGGGGGSSSHRYSYPDTAAQPMPAHGQTNVSTYPQLSWSGGSGEDVDFALFMGTSSTRVLLMSANIDDMYFRPGLLRESTTYYWRIDSHNRAGTTTGTMWSFTTGTSTKGSASVIEAEARGTDAHTKVPTDTHSWRHTITPATGSARATGAGYLPPYFTYAGIYGMLMKVYSAGDTLYLVVGSGSKLQRVYGEAKILHRGTWRPLQMSGIWSKEPDGYYIGKAYYILRPDDALYARTGSFIATIRTAIPGCTASTCTGPGWHLQEFAF